MFVPKPLPFGVLFSARPDGVGGLSFQFLSEHAEEFLEFSEAEVKRLYAARELPLVDIDVEAFYASASESLANRTPWCFEFGLRMPKSNRVRWFQACDFPHDDESGSFYLIGMIVEITQAKRDHDELRTAYRSLDSHMDNTPLAVIEWDRAMRVVRWTGQAEAMFGFRADEVLGKQPHEWNFVHRDDQSRVQDVVANLVGDRESRKVVFNRNLHASGAVLDIEWHNSVVRGNDGQIASVLSLAMDVTAQRRSAEALQHSDDRLRSAFRTADMLGWEFDLISSSAYFSSDPALHHGSAESTTVDRIDDFADFVHNDDRAAFAAAVASCLATRQDLKLEYRGRTVDADGRTRWFLTQGSLSHCDRVGVNSIIGVTTDISERKRVEMESVRLDRELADMRKRESLTVLAGGIAHDFNNLLTVILGNAGLIRSAIAEQRGIETLLESIETATQRGAELCRKMTAYAGVDRLPNRKVDLRGILLESSELMRSLLPASAEFRLRIPDSLGTDSTINGDEDQFRQLMLNLVTNAAEALPAEGGVVEVELEHQEGLLPSAGEFKPKPADGRWLLLTVRDNGTGMTTETQSRAFEPFYSTKFAGRGLGLATVHGIAHSHGASIRLESGPVRGTCVQILFPIESRMKENDKPFVEWTSLETSTVLPIPSRGHALVVDDELFIRELTASVLEDAGYQVETAADGSEGLLLLQSKLASWRLVVLDRVMPGLNGSVLFQMLRGERPDLPIVMMSGYESHANTADPRWAGPTAELAKPFRLAQFIEAVRSVVAAAAHIKNPIE